MLLCQQNGLIRQGPYWLWCDADTLKKNPFEVFTLSRDAPRLVVTLRESPSLFRPKAPNADGKEEPSKLGEQSSSSYKLPATPV